MDHLAALSQLKEKIDDLLEASAERLVLRIVAFTFIISIVPTCYFIYTNYLNSVVVRQDSNDASIKSLNTNKILLSGVVGKLNLCLKSREQKNRESDWICETAMKHYAKQSESWPTEDRTQIITRKLVEAALSDVEYHAIIIASDIAEIGKTKSTEKIILESISDRNVLYFLIFSMILSGAYAQYCFFRYRKKKLGRGTLNKLGRRKGNLFNVMVAKSVEMKK